jgi:hypothetical protein
MDANAPERCATCDRVPLMLFIVSKGIVVSARFGCLCSTVWVDPDNHTDVARPDMTPKGRLPA